MSKRDINIEATKNLLDTFISEGIDASLYSHPLTAWEYGQRDLKTKASKAAGNIQRKEFTENWGEVATLVKVHCTSTVWFVFISIDGGFLIDRGLVGDRTNTISQHDNPLAVVEWFRESSKKWQNKEKKLIKLPYGYDGDKTMDWWI